MQLPGHIQRKRLVSADETPVQMLMPGTKRTHRSLRLGLRYQPILRNLAGVYDFSLSLSLSLSSAGEHVRNFLQDWKGKLVCDDFGGCKASFEPGVIEIGCMAHARRKFFELHAPHKRTLAEQPLPHMQALYEIKGEMKVLEPDYADEYGKKRRCR
jgi:transposase